MTYKILDMPWRWCFWTLTIDLRLPGYSSLQRYFKLIVQRETVNSWYFVYVFSHNNHVDHHYDSDDDPATLYLHSRWILWNCSMHADVLHLHWRSRIPRGKILRLEHWSYASFWGFSLLNYVNLTVRPAPELAFSSDHPLQLANAQKTLPVVSF